MGIFAHLIEDTQFIPEPVNSAGGKITSFDSADPADIIDGQFNTVEWLEKMGVKTIDELDPNAVNAVSAEVFSTLTTTDNVAAQRKVLTMAKSPAAVRKLVGMLTAYDWSFVEQAQEMRGYAVSKLIEEIENTRDARVRLKAIELLGRVTEVGLFTDKIKVERSQMSDNELDNQIKERLSMYANLMRPREMVEGELIESEPTGPESTIENEDLGDGPEPD